MADDWRIRIELEEEHAPGLFERLGFELSDEASELAQELAKRRLAVSSDDDEVFVYAGSPAEAQSARAVIDVCIAHQVPCTAHLEILDAADLLMAGLHGIEHITSIGSSLAPRVEREAYRQAVLADNDARRDGRYELFSHIQIEGPEAQAFYEILRMRHPWIDPTLAVFERRAVHPQRPARRRPAPAGAKCPDRLTRRPRLLRRATRPWPGP